MTPSPTLSTYAVTAVGPDAPGEVAALAEALAALGANLEDASMTRLRGHFAMTFVASVDAAAEQVEAALGPVADGTGLHVTVWPVERAEPAPAGDPWRVTVHGADRPGIVARVAGTVAAHGGNITDLGCRLAGDLYVMTVEVDLAEPAGLEGALADVAVELGVTVHLDRVDADVLQVELEVRTAPDPVLSSPARPVDPADPAVVALAEAMVALMAVSPGCVGIAAPQVGHPERLFVLDVTGARKVRSCSGLVVLCNPVLVSSEGAEQRREGCLSVPDLTGDVVRATSVVVRGAVPGTGEERVVEADAFEARAFQHELDHLDGRLFLDRVAGAHALFARKRYL